MKKFALTAAVLVAGISPAYAASVTTTDGTSAAVFAAPPGYGSVSSFDGLAFGTSNVIGTGANGVAAGFTLTQNGSQVVNGSMGGQYAAPAVAGVAETTDFLNIFADTSATLSSALAFTSVSLYWGSIDTYNSLQLLDAMGGVIDTVLGTSLPPANGNQTAVSTNARVTITSNTPFYGVKFISTGQNAFELDNVAFANAVPEPAAWGMMLLGFGLVGGALRRRRQSVNVSYA